MDNFVTFMQLLNHLLTLPSCITAYTPGAQLPFPPDVCYKSGKLKVSVYPCELHQMCRFWLQHLGSVTLIISLRSAQEKTTCWQICSSKDTHTHLMTTTHLQHYITIAFIPHQYEHPALAVNISLDMANFNMVNIIIIRLLHMAALEGP